MSTTESYQWNVHFKHDYNSRSWLSTLLYSWCGNLIQYVHKSGGLNDAEQWIEMNPNFKTEILWEKFNYNFNIVLEAEENNKWKLAKAIKLTFGKIITINMIFGLLPELIVLINFYVTKYLIDWIQDQYGELWKGCVYSVIWTLLLIISLLIRHKFFFDGAVVGLNIK